MFSEHLLHYRLDFTVFATLTLAGAFVAQHFLRTRALAGRFSARFWLLVGLFIASGGGLAEYFGKQERMRLQQSVSGLAPTYAYELEQMGHAQITLNTPPDDPRYLAMIEAEKAWLQRNPLVADIYTYRRLPDGKFVFIVDSETDYDHNGRYEGPREARTPIGTPNESTDEFDIRAANGEAVFDPNITVDEWGVWVSAMQPMFDAHGHVEAVLGVDFPAAGWVRAILRARAMTLSTAFLVMLLLAGAVRVTRLRSEIAERKRTEDIIRRSEEKFRSIFENSPIGIFQITPHGRLLTANAATAEIFGFASPAELLDHVGTQPDSLLSDPAPHNEMLRAAGESERVVRREVRYRRRDGTVFIGSVSIRRLRGARSEDGVLEGFIEDVTELRQKADEILDRNRELALLNRVMATPNAVSDPIALLQVACRELALAFDLTQAAAALLNDDRTAATVVAEYRPEGRPSVLHASRPLAEVPLIQRLIQQKQPVVVQEPGSDPSMGTAQDLTQRREARTMLALPLIVEDRVEGALFLGAVETRSFTATEVDLARNVANETARGLALARLSEIRHRLMRAVEQARECISITDAEGTLQYVNAAFEQTTGYGRNQAVGQTHRILKSDRQDPALYRDLWATITAGRAWQGRIINRKKDGSVYTADTVITPVRDASGLIMNYIAAGRDITRELQLEEQFWRSQKMEAVGQLAAGVAHDFNNIIGAMLLHLNLMGLDPGLASKLRTELKELEEACGRAANLTRQLLMFSRKHVAQIKSVNLGQLLDSFLKMLRRLLGEQVEVVLQSHGGPHWIEADPGMIEQVVMNLCVNARDAMPRGGRVTITTTAIDVDAASAKEYAKGGNYVCLAVADTGEGMDAVTLQRIFEPFFTTKEAGKGTGLGLATVYGIARQHRGWVDVESAVGKGSTFRIYIPQAARATPSRTSAPGFEGRTGTETILVVEDERNVRDTAAQCLREFGYRVEEAADGVAALALWEQHHAQIGLVLIDLILPGKITGLELAQQFRRSKPGLKVIIMSGYLENMARLESVIVQADMSCVIKPFALDKLLKLIRQRLDEK
ncbi:MAG TPA: PAS domain S-box protein [Opitutaceae bacterium]|nr:PAS domain S-box protein [Opitutaceae bacterium]